MTEHEHEHEKLDNANGCRQSRVVLSEKGQILKLKTKNTLTVSACDLLGSTSDGDLYPSRRLESPVAGATNGDA